MKAKRFIHSIKVKDFHENWNGAWHSAHSPRRVHWRSKAKKPFISWFMQLNWYFVSDDPLYLLRFSLLFCEQFFELSLLIIDCNRSEIGNAKSTWVVDVFEQWWTRKPSTSTNYWRIDCSCDKGIGKASSTFGQLYWWLYHYHCNEIPQVNF